MDVLLCTASIIHLCAIAVNRYLAVTFPQLYTRELVNSRSRILGTIIPVWTIAIAACLPLAVQGVIQSEYNLTDNGDSCGFFDRTFIAYSSMCSFYGPLLIMIVVDFRAVRKLHKRKQSLERLGNSSGKYPRYTQSVTPDDSPSLSHHQTRPGQENLIKRPLRIDFRGDTKGSFHGYRSTTLEVIRPIERNFHSNKREKRAAKTLVVVFVCVIVLWMPFFVMHLINGLCTTCQIPDNVFSVLTWLGYVNPCIYTCLNRDFRRAFSTIVLCKAKSRQNKSVRFTESSTVPPSRNSIKYRR